MAPVSLRAADDTESANAVGFITANLATDEADPMRRIRTIQESMLAGKAQLSGMSRREIEIYTVLTQAPLLLTALTGSTHRFPAFSTVVSNVPGPRQPMYWNGARLSGLYPVSIPFDGFAINFTVVSNNDSLDFGIVACRHSVPQVQRMIDYMEEALTELEDAAGLATPGAQPKAPRRAASRPKKAAAGKTAAKKGAAKKGAAKKKKASRGKRSPASKRAASKKKAAPVKKSAKTQPRRQARSG